MLRALTKSKAFNSPAIFNPYPKHVEAQRVEPPLGEISKETLETLKELSDKEMHAIIELKSIPYQVSKNDILIVNRMNGTDLHSNEDLALGDTIVLDRIRQIGGLDWHLKGNPFIRPEYVQIKAVCIEHTKAAPITRTHWKVIDLTYLGILLAVSPIEIWSGQICH